MNRTKDGKFKKLSIAQKAQRLHAKGLTNAQIAKKLNVRPQNVFRALNRGKYGRPRVALKDSRLVDAEACTNELCLDATSDVCECPCEGTGHGARHLQEAADAEIAEAEATIAA